MKKNQQGNFSLTYPPRIRYILMAAIFSFYCLLFFSTNAHAQKRSVTGVITSEYRMLHVFSKPLNIPGKFNPVYFNFFILIKKN